MRWVPSAQAGRGKGAVDGAGISGFGGVAQGRGPLLGLAGMGYQRGPVRRA